jgi:hypothetical protein
MLYALYISFYIRMIYICRYDKKGYDAFLIFPGDICLRTGGRQKLKMYDFFLNRWLKISLTSTNIIVRLVFIRYTAFDYDYSLCIFKLVFENKFTRRCRA